MSDRLRTFNDSKQLQRTLQLFQQYRKLNNETPSSSANTQVLKACVHLKDIRSEKAIYDLVSSHTKNNQHIVTLIFTA
ncbi:unnamed protein product [Adineta ricciae]|uniref:Uncharacterized protein n=1 Tax=Adineta ricciae TaxID=249248 RepID=A0A813M8M1_ADIRI|nr:unnamed protein product [Adineta ricciae]CAF1162033.1 unnamed protein product [Adineta ricciae]